MHIAYRDQAPAIAVLLVSAVGKIALSKLFRSLLAFHLSEELSIALGFGRKGCSHGLNVLIGLAGRPTAFRALAASSGIHTWAPRSAIFIQVEAITAAKRSRISKIILANAK
jgi:hypothetical protein